VYYILIKILHILSAALLITGMGYSYHLWRHTRSPRDGAIRNEHIQTLTWLIILPLAIIQFVTGFLMISLKNEALSQTWIIGSILGFVIAIGGWISFIYSLLLSQQVEIRDNAAQPVRPWGERRLYYRRVQSLLLTVCALAMLVMIFLMANKVA
jgi:uncharacterized membrane protein